MSLKNTALPRRRTATPRHTHRSAPSGNDDRRETSMVAVTNHTHVSPYGNVKCESDRKARTIAWQLDAGAEFASCGFHGHGLDLQWQERRKTAIRYGLAWSILNPSVLTNYDQYAALDGYNKDMPLHGDRAALARAIPKNVSVHMGTLLDYRVASDEEIHCYLSGEGAGFDYSDLFANCVASHT